MKKWIVLAAAVVMMSGQAAFASGVMKAAREACKADVKEHCVGIKPGEGRVACCLKQHESSLEQACKDALAPSKLYQKLSSSCTTTGSNKGTASAESTADPASGL